MSNLWPSSTHGHRVADAAMISRIRRFVYVDMGRMKNKREESSKGKEKAKRSQNALSHVANLALFRVNFKINYGLETRCNRP